MARITVGIYPGAFDPVHDGHVAFAEAALLKHGLDKVYFLPEPRPRHKQGVKALEHRVAMVERAIRSNPRFGTIVLEQQRFTVHQTWPLLVSRFAGAKMYLLLGSDVAGHLASWPDIDELISTAPQFVIALRGSDISEVNRMMGALRTVKKLDIQYSLLETHHPLYGSSRVRHSLRHGHTPGGVHPDVLRYIRDQKLYISGAM